MLNKIWQFLKRLIQRLLGTAPPPPPPPPPRPTLTDAECESKFMELLEGVNAGWSRGDVAGFLIAKRLKDGELAAWLRRFGTRLLEGENWQGGQGETDPGDAVASLQELGGRLELLGRVGSGELSQVAGDIGREILTRFPLPVVEDGGGNGRVIEAVFVGDGLGFSEGGNRTDAEDESNVDAEAKVWFDRGYEQCMRGDFIGAIASYDKALQFKPDNNATWNNRGIALRNLERLEEAIASYDKALEFQPDDHLAWNNRGVALYTLERLEEAIASYNKALQFKPDDHLAWYNRGNALNDLGRLEEAIASYGKALEFKPDFHKAWNNRGKALDDLGRLEEAIASYDKALEFKPDDPKAWHSRGFALNNLERLEEAIASYDKALEIKPNFHEAWNNRGAALGNLERLEEELASYDKALEFKPDYYKTWHNRGIALGNLERLEEAIASFDKALEFKPDYYEAWNNRGGVLYHLGLLEEAIASFDKALKFKPDYHEAWYNRGVALSKLERLEEAIASFDKALKFKPDYHEAWYNRGATLYTLERLEEAIASFDHAITIKQDRWASWIGRGSAAGQLETQNILSPFISAIAIQNPALNQRGYQGQLTSYQEGLKYVDKNKEPEGWGELHWAIGRTHYRRWQSNPRLFPNLLSPAINSYYLALQTLTKDAFTKLHLELLQDLIKALLRAEKTEEAHKLRRDATNLLHRLLQQENYSQLSKQQLTDKLVSFQQLTVNIFMESGQILQALDTAELDKNVCLSWLLDALPIPPYPEAPAETVTHAQIQQLLNPQTAAIYWHLSDAALTTFTIKSDGLLSPENCLSTFPEKFEAWVKDWNRQYADYQGKSKEESEQENHPWRAQMPGKFAELKEILQVSAIEQQLKLSGITDLILIPHRDLHRFPIHALFGDEFAISYLPSIRVGLNLKHRFNDSGSRGGLPLRENETALAESPDDTNDKKQTYSLLSIENPDSIEIYNGKEIESPPLPAAESESEMICQMFPNHTRLGNNSATLNRVTNLLQQQHSIFHFTGHGRYEFSNPLESLLYLSKTERLTVREIIHLNLSNYQLICLSACETAVTANQNITSEYVGLVSGFMRAGAASVISTLWPVQSTASALFAIYFYQQWLETGLSKPEALAATKIWLRDATREKLKAWYQGEIDKLPKDNVKLRRFFNSNLRLLDTIELNQPYQHPYYWAAFTLTGS